MERLNRLFEDLTPGGSEFHDSPDNCAAWARNRVGMTSKIAMERNVLRDQLEAAREEYAALTAERDALAQQLQQAQAQLAAVPVDAMRLLLWGDATQPGYANAVGTVGDWLIAEQDAANAAAELRAPTYNGGCW